MLVTLGRCVSWSLLMSIFPILIDLQQSLRPFSIASPESKEIQYYVIRQSLI